MQKKENLPPVKQGVFYQLNLNKNSGPFLAKDIMFNNPKSNMLLTNHEMHHEHAKMMETLSHLEKTGKMQPSHETKTESFSTIIQSCELELSTCLKISRSLQAAQQQFKGEIECLYDKVSNINNQLIESSLPVLKNLMKKVKEVNQADKAEYYKISKELQSIEMQKRSLEHIVLNCTNRIEDLEKHFGVINQFFERTRSSNGFITPLQFD